MVLPGRASDDDADLVLGFVQPEQLQPKTSTTKLIKISQPPNPAAAAAASIPSSLQAIGKKRRKLSCHCQRGVCVCTNAGERMCHFRVEWLISGRLVLDGAKTKVKLAVERLECACGFLFLHFSAANSAVKVLFFHSNWNENRVHKNKSLQEWCIPEVTIVPRESNGKSLSLTLRASFFGGKLLSGLFPFSLRGALGKVGSLVRC